MSRSTGNILRYERNMNPNDRVGFPVLNDDGRVPVKPVSFKPQQSTAELALRVLRARKSFTQGLPRDLFRDTAWLILLELFVAHENHRNVCVKQVMLASDESPAGIIRRLDRLEMAGLLTRRADPNDNRRILIALTETGRASISSFLRTMFVPHGEEIGAVPSAESSQILR
jgi:DNA-binding MarR family transcriptional regulator